MALGGHGLPLGTLTYAWSVSIHLVNFMGRVHKEIRLLPSRMPPLPSFPDSLLARPTEQRHWPLYGRNLIRETRRGGGLPLVCVGRGGVGLALGGPKPSLR